MKWKTDHCELRTLSHFLETKIAWHRFKSLARRGSILQCHDRMQLYGQFLNSLNAYLLAPRNDTQLTVTRRPVSLDFGDCTQLRWSRLFTGKRRKKRLKVLHFVPIGYNIRLLEAMFHELYDAVDYFVLYETDATQIGVRKEMFYDKTKERWAKFHDKIIHLTDHIDDSMANSVLQASCRRENWQLEHRMRSRPVQKFREIMDQYNLGDPKDVLVLGSDADEIAKGEAVWALSHCHIKNDPDLEQSIVYFGTLLGTGTLTALRYLGDGVCSADGQGPQELARAVWGAGPVVKTLSRVLREGSAPRVYPSMVGCQSREQKTSHEVLHMPVGCAFHLSSINEPVMRLYKEGGTIEGGGRSSFLSVSHIVAAQSEDKLDRHALHGLMTDRAETVSVFLMKPESQRIWNESLPWIMRENPQYFCFELPLGLPASVDG